MVVASTPFGGIGLSICYDLRFPELYRSQGEVAAWFVPSAFTATTGAAHWETLLRARAIENLCYVVAPAQGGLHANGRRTHGHTMIVDPWGEVLSLKDVTGYPLQPVHGPAKLGETRRIFLDTSRATKELNWKPTIPLSEGLKYTVEYFRSVEMAA